MNQLTSRFLFRLRGDQYERPIYLDSWRGRYFATHVLPDRAVTRAASYGTPLRALDVIEFCVINLRSRMQIAVFGWPTVRKTLLRGRCGRTLHSCDEPSCQAQVVQLVAAARVASLVPFVSTNCLQVASTVASMCRRRHLEHRVEIGSLNSPFQPHIWVESHGMHVDPIDSSATRERFEGVHV